MNGRQNKLLEELTINADFFYPFSAIGVLLDTPDAEIHENIQMLSKKEQLEVLESFAKTELEEILKKD